MAKTKDNIDTAVYKCAMMTRWTYALIEDKVKGGWWGNTSLLSLSNFNKEFEAKTHFKRGVLRINITIEMYEEE